MIDFYNEAYLSMLIYQFMFYTDWVDSIMQQFNLGWIMLAFIILFIASNMMIIFYFASRHIYLIYKKYKNRFNYYKDQYNSQTNSKESNTIIA